MRPCGAALLHGPRTLRRFRDALPARGLPHTLLGARVDAYREGPSVGARSSPSARLVHLPRPGASTALEQVLVGSWAGVAGGMGGRVGGVDVPSSFCAVRC